MKRFGRGAALFAWMAWLLPVAGFAPAGAQGAGGTAAAEPSSMPATVDSAPSGPVLEPYRWNARERTARALAAWKKGQTADAVAPLDSALRLQPGDPLVEYNAGTAHLAASQPDAAQLLEQAAEHAPPGLAADALYNLGNARLATQDAKGAIEAYKSSLRAQADLPGAKRNLELALRLLEEQQRQQEQQQKDSREKRQKEGDPDPNREQDGGEEQQDPNRSSQAQQPSKPDQKPQDSPQQGDGQPQQGQPSKPSKPEEPAQNRPLPQFQDQKDMTAEQAAAILQAVENLERQQRRDQARALARAKTSVEKDW